MTGVIKGHLDPLKAPCKSWTRTKRVVLRRAHRDSVQTAANFRLAKNRLLFKPIKRMRPLPVALVLAIASLNCLGMKQHSHQNSGHHVEHYSGHEHSAGVYHTHRYPLYIMQLYRDYRAVDTRRTAASVNGDDLHQTDSILSLVAKGRSVFFFYK